MAEFCSARSETIPPLPWTNFAPPFPVQDRNEEDQALGYLVAFLGFSWAALTAYVKQQQLNGGGIVLAVLFLLSLSEVEDLGIVKFCIVWAFLYLIAIVIGLAALTRHESGQARKAAELLERAMKLLENEREQTTRKLPDAVTQQTDERGSSL